MQNNKWNSKEILISADTKTRSERGYIVCIMTKTTNENEYSFLPRTISQWNCLPKTLVESGSVDDSKHGLKDLNSPP